MAVQTNDEIIKQQVIDNFRSNLLNTIFSGNPRHSGNVPRFTKTAGGISTAAGTSRTYTQPNAIDVGQLDSNSQPSVSIPNETITAADTYNSLKEIVDKLTKIRYYTSNWYYQTNGNLALVESVEGTAIFKATIPGLDAYSSATKVDGYVGWNRQIEDSSAGVGSSASTTTTLYVNNPFIQNQEVKADQVGNIATNDSLFSNLYTAWMQARAKRITYTYYTCHSNCHSNWTDVRSRR